MIISIFLLTGWIIINCNAFTCEEEILGFTILKECPGRFDDIQANFCCGPKNQRGCCRSLDGKDEESISQNIVKRAIMKRSTEPTEPTVNPQTVVTQEGLRDDVTKLKTKIKEKINGTVADAKQKVKDKAQKKIEEKLDPTGGYLKLPAIIGIVIGLIIVGLILCFVCCCCCPFCLIYQRRQINSQNPTPGDVQMQPLTNVEREYTSVKADTENPAP